MKTKERFEDLLAKRGAKEIELLDDAPWKHGVEYDWKIEVKDQESWSETLSWRVRMTTDKQEFWVTVSGGWQNVFDAYDYDGDPEWKSPMFPLTDAGLRQAAEEVARVVGLDTPTEATGQPTPALDQRAVDAINRHRRSLGQTPLDPVASGWTQRDVELEAQRIAKLNPDQAKLKRRLMR